MKAFRNWFRKTDKQGPSDSTIGGILLRYGFITMDQLRSAITAKTNASQADLLGEVLISQGAITRSQLERVLLIQRAERGEKVDYTVEMQNLVAQASQQAENLHGPLDELEDAARRLSVTRTDLPIVPKGEKKH